MLEAIVRDPKATSRALQNTFSMLSDIDTGIGSYFRPQLIDRISAHSQAVRALLRSSLLSEGEGLLLIDGIRRIKLQDREFLIERGKAEDFLSESQIQEIKNPQP